jgi:hypothetical protein
LVTGSAEPPPELLDYTLRMRVYGGITPEQLDRIPQRTIDADVECYNALQKYRPESPF